MSAKEKIFEQFQNGSLANKTAQEICKILQIPYREKNRLISLLNELVKEEKIFTNDGGRYGTSAQLGLIKGQIVGNKGGYAFLVPEDKERFQNDFFIPKKSLRGAYHNDIVLAERVFGTQDEVCVTHILSRGNTQIVGTFRKDRHAGYLFPDDTRFSTELFIPLSDCYHIKNGVKAVAKITEYPFKKSPAAKIIEVLGDEDDFFAEELSIIRAYDLKESFPPQVEEEAQKQQARGISPQDLCSRRDFRDQLIVTIDGEDTRDIDDAVTLQKQGEEYLLGVHIADVSHYVQAKSPLDKEAFERGTSVYFPDRVLPMLPKALSNGICSLNENEERLTLSCLMTIDKKGNVIASEIVEGVIKSAHKLTYHEIDQMLEGDKEICEKYADVKDMVSSFAELTRILQEKRHKKGSISLDVKEAKILFDPVSQEITIPDYERAFSYQIIEAFMVLANETVATYARDIEAPFIYRIHEKPSEEKAANFRSFAQTLGLRARFQADDVKPYDYQNLLNEAKEKPYFPVLNRVMLRSMQKARYDTENVGHFGLASDCYCHFTSPIRRYPDLCIHRILKEIIHGRYGEIMEKYLAFVERAADQSSDRERRATDVERDVDDLYKTMYMSEHIGEEYDAVISGVASFGLFAELPNTIEGFIAVESLFGDFVHEQEKMKLVSKDKTFQIGDTIRVRVHDVDFERRRTELRYVEPSEMIKCPHQGCVE